MSDAHDGFRFANSGDMREHQDHLTIRRLNHNQPITATDLTGLEALLFSEDGPGSKADFQEFYGDRPLGELVPVSSD